MSSAYVALMNKGLDKVMKQNYKPKNLVATQIFDKETITSRYRSVMNMQGYPRPALRYPGGPIAAGTFAQSFGMFDVVTDWGLFDCYPMEDIKDDLYGVLKTTGAEIGGGMARAFMVHIEYLCFEYLASLALGSASGSGLGTFDGYSLCSTAHPVSKENTAATWNNRPSAELNMSIAAADYMYTALAQTPMENGYEFIAQELASVLIHPNSHRVTEQVFNSRATWERSSAEYNLNVYSGKVKIIETPYWMKSGTTGTYNAWLGFAAGFNNLKLVMREEPIAHSWMNEALNTACFARMMRLLLTCDNARGMVGSTGA